MQTVVTAWAPEGLGLIGGYHDKIPHMSKKRYTRSGARRAGDDYQDLVALDLMVEWLEHPERFDLVKLEDDEAGSLDDVTAILPDGRVILRQSKFATDPDELLTWGRLLEQTKGTKGTLLPSLLQKWARTYQERKGATKGIVEAALFTNRRYGGDLDVALSPQRFILLNRVTDSVTTAEIVNQLGGRSAAEEFFAGFQFRADLPSYEDYEAGLLERFKRIGGTAAGWTALKDAVRRWIRNAEEPHPGGGIELADVRQAALWHSPEVYKEHQIGSIVKQIEDCLNRTDRLATDVVHRDFSLRATYGEAYDSMYDEERELMEEQWLDSLRLADDLMSRAFEVVGSQVLAARYEAEVAPYRSDLLRVSIRPYTGDYYVPVIDVMLRFLNTLVDR